MANALQVAQIQPVDVGQAYGNALAIAKGQREVKAMDQKAQSDAMALKKERLGQALATGYRILPKLQFEHYGQFRQGMLQSGVAPQALPEINSPDQFETWRQDALQSEGSLAQQFGLKTDRYSVQQGGEEVTLERMPWSGREVEVGRGPKFKPESGTWGQPTEVTGQDGKPMLVQVNSRTGQVRPVDGYGPKPPRGMRVDVDKDGVSFVSNADMGAGGSQQLTKPNVNKQQDEFLALQDQAAEFAELERLFDPSFLTLEGRGKSFLLTIKDHAGLSMTPEQEQFYSDRNQFMTSAYNQINNYIKKITGAALSKAEADRIMKAMPNPNDPPRQYADKLNAAKREVRLSLARKAYALQKGLDFDDVSLARMPTIIDKRGDQLFQQIKQENPQADEDEIGSLVRQSLQKEFGVI